jgi:hypothetical protein
MDPANVVTYTEEGPTHKSRMPAMMCLPGQFGLDENCFFLYAPVSLLFAMQFFRMGK